MPRKTWTAHRERNLGKPEPAKGEKQKSGHHRSQQHASRRSHQAGRVPVSCSPCQSGGKSPERLHVFSFLSLYLQRPVRKKTLQGQGSHNRERAVTMELELRKLRQWRHSRTHSLMVEDQRDTGEQRRQTYGFVFSRQAPAGFQT